MIDPMPAPEKFMFDRSFDPPEVLEVEEPIEEETPEVPEMIIPTFSEDDMIAAREAGIAVGREEGVREATEATERLIVDTVQTVNTQLAQIIDHQQSMNAEIFQDAINAGIAVVRKCFPQMNVEQGINEIESMIGQVLSQVLEEPRIIIHVHNHIKVPLSQRMSAITQHAHFEGRVVIRDDPELPEGDCRIEWSNGEAERDMGKIWQQIDEIIKSNLAVAATKLEFSPVEPRDLQPSPALADIPENEPADEDQSGSSHLSNQDVPVDTDTVANTAQSASTEDTNMVLSSEAPILTNTTDADASDTPEQLA